MSAYLIRPVRNAPNNGLQRTRASGAFADLVCRYMVIVTRCLAFVACLVCVACGEDPESSGPKSENSVIQAMGARYEHATIEQLAFKTEMDYHFVFIPWHGGHVCIMLDPKHTPHYKQDPWTQNFYITQADLDVIERSDSVTDTVRAVLASHVCDSRDHNQSMKPTPKAFASRLAPWRNKPSVFATSPFRGLSLSR